MHSTNQPASPAIIDYGIAHAFDFYTLSELVRSQVKKGFQPYEKIFSTEHTDGTVYCQVLVKYATNKPAVPQKKQLITNNKTKQKVPTCKK